MQGSQEAGLEPGIRSIGILSKAIPLGFETNPLRGLSMSRAGSSQDHSPGSTAPQDFEARRIRLRSEVVEAELCLRNTESEVKKFEAQEYRDKA